MPCSCEVGSGWVLGKSATSDGKEDGGGGGKIHAKLMVQTIGGIYIRHTKVIL